MRHSLLFRGVVSLLSNPRVWDKTMSPSAECYTFGYRTTVKAKSTLLTFAGSKSFFGIVVFLIPPTEYFRSSLKRKQVLAMTSLFAVGLMWVSVH